MEAAEATSFIEAVSHEFRQPELVLLDNQKKPPYPYLIFDFFYLFVICLWTQGIGVGGDPCVTNWID